MTRAACNMSMNYLILVVSVGWQQSESPREINLEINRLRREVDRFAALIAGGNAPNRVVEEIAKRESQIEELQAKLAQVENAHLVDVDVDQIRELAFKRAKALHSTLNANVGRGRQVLSQLLAGPITFKMHGAGYQLEGKNKITRERNAAMPKKTNRLGEELAAARAINAATMIASAAAMRPQLAQRKPPLGKPRPDAS